ncbi:unnamed protein product [Allacma fusca]|uniref:Gamma-aminobutyric acid type B receptor subunit 2 n=1 Tax=Allacma fusca TaxID=39272 RepID=A0A8J2PGK5_9HEXA|nr:unnamed protein product [Allacma fusca]
MITKTHLEAYLRDKDGQRTCAPMASCKYMDAQFWRGLLVGRKFSGKENIKGVNLIHLIGRMCDAAEGMKSFFDAMHQMPRKIMLFGDACKSVTDPIAKASKHWKIAQLSYADIHPMYSKKNYPNLFRIVPSENEFNAPRIQLLKMFNWTLVGTLYQNNPRYSLAHNRLVADLEVSGVKVVAAQSFADDITYQLQQLKEKDVRIILGNFNETWARRIFCEAYREKLFGKKYQWLIVGTYSRQWWRKEDVNCSLREIEAALKGAILMDLLPLSTSQEITVSGRTAGEYKELYDVVSLGEYSRFHGYAYDGIWAIALALQNISSYFEEGSGIKTRRSDLLSTFRYRDDAWEKAFLSALEATSFIGVTGLVQFRDNGRKGSVLIKQFQAFNTVNAEVKVGEYDGVTATLSLLKGQNITWNGKSPPKDRTYTRFKHPSLANSWPCQVAGVLSVLELHWILIQNGMSIEFAKDDLITCS